MRYNRSYGSRWGRSAMIVPTATTSQDQEVSGWTWAFVCAPYRFLHWNLPLIAMLTHDPTLNLVFDLEQIWQDESIGIFVRAALPWSKEICDVDLDPGQLGQLVVLGHEFRTSAPRSEIPLSR